MEKKSINLKLPISLAEEIKRYQRENFISTFTGAIIQLLTKGLKK